MIEKTLMAILTIFAYEMGLKVAFSFGIGYMLGFVSSSLLNKRKHGKK